MRTNKPEILDELQTYLPPSWMPSSDPTVDYLYSLKVSGGVSRKGIRHFNLLYSGSEMLIRSLDIQNIFASFEENVAHAVAAGTRTRVFVRAGVVGWNGKAIVIPGSTATGKTNLVTELVRRGAVYYSDKYAVFDGRARIHPFASPLGIRTNGDASKTKTNVESLGGVQGVKPLPIGAIVITRYREGAKWRPHQVSGGNAALALLESVVPARHHPERLLSVLGESGERAPAFKGVRGEASETAERLLERFENLMATTR